MDFEAIDWNAMWQNESSFSHWGKNNAAKKDLWNKRADRFSKRINKIMGHEEKLDKDDYISKILERIKVNPDWSVLDIGCGPGTLAIPLARKVRSLTALDLSSEMLKHLKMNAQNNGLNNIRCVNAPWEEAVDEKQVGIHDVIVASRSIMPGDLKETLKRIISVTGRAAYLTFPVIHLPFDCEVYRAIGRTGKRHPPYIYVYNQLYQMNIPANVEILCSRVKMQCSGVEETIRDLEWRTDPFTAEEREKLQNFLVRKFSEQKDATVFTHEGYSKWALIWWLNENQ